MKREEITATDALSWLAGQSLIYASHPILNGILSGRLRLVYWPASRIWEVVSIVDQSSAVLYTGDDVNRAVSIFNKATAPCAT